MVGPMKKSNLQPLCKSCHTVKTYSEHDPGQFIRINDTESTYSTQVQEIMDSPLSQTHAFVERAYLRTQKQLKQYIQLTSTNVGRIYYIMESLIIVCLIKWMNSKALKLDSFYIILKLIITCL